MNSPMFWFILVQIVWNNIAIFIKLLQYFLLFCITLNLQLVWIFRIL